LINASTDGSNDSSSLDGTWQLGRAAATAQAAAGGADGSSGQLQVQRIVAQELQQQQQQPQQPQQQPQQQKLQDLAQASGGDAAAAAAFGGGSEYSEELPSQVTDEYWIHCHRFDDDTCEAEGKWMLVRCCRASTKLAIT
jgi:hypothetical protein